MKKTVAGIPYPFFLWLVFTIPFIQTCKTISPIIKDITIEDVKRRIHSIETYHVYLTAKIFGSPQSSGSAPNHGDPGHFVETKSVVYGESGKKMKIITVVTPSASDIEMEHMLLFDGTWLWIQQKIIKHPEMTIDQPMITVMKIHIPSVSPDPIKEPFNTIYGVTGIGLFRYQDLPGTLYRLIDGYDYIKDTPKNMPDGTLFRGQIGDHPRSDEKKEMDPIHQSATLWVGKKRGLVKAYAMGPSEEKPSIHTQIEYISINEKLPVDTFTYRPPKGVAVKDGTASLLKKKMRKK